MHGGKQGSEPYRGLAVVRCPLQGVLRGLVYEKGRRMVAESENQNVTSTGVTKQWERAKSFRDKGSSEGIVILLVGKTKKMRNHQITNRQH